MIGVHKSLDPILIEEYSDKVELLVVEAKIENKDVRIISGYGPQEGWKDEERLPFFSALEEEITKAELGGKSILLSFDANSKLGSEWISNDPHKQSPNGKLLAVILERHALIVVNGIKEKCQGTITRLRTTVKGTEKSAIDLVIISKDIVDELVDLKIDEEREHNLTSFTRKGIAPKFSDHNSLISNLQLSMERVLHQN